MYIPRYPQPKLLLIPHKRRKHANQHAARREHDDDPQVQLLVGPVVGLPDHDAGARLLRVGGAGHAGFVAVVVVARASGGFRQSCWRGWPARRVGGRRRGEGGLGCARVLVGVCGCRGVAVGFRGRGWYAGG